MCAGGDYIQVDGKIVKSSQIRNELSYSVIGYNHDSKF